MPRVDDCVPSARVVRLFEACSATCRAGCVLVTQRYTEPLRGAPLRNATHTLHNKICRSARFLQTVVHVDRGGERGVRSAPQEGSGGSLRGCRRSRRRPCRPRAAGSPASSAPPAPPAVPSQATIFLHASWDTPKLELTLRTTSTVGTCGTSPAVYFDNIEAQFAGTHTVQLREMSTAIHYTQWKISCVRACMGRELGRARTEACSSRARGCFGRLVGAGCASTAAAAASEDT